ncbi:hypothetical protein [Halobacterium rubrum]|uniref:hypothetical protein n=1 Tax=Halobacterium TaxID=2239 RepID=UPI001F180C63|nr:MULTISPECIES: hypothetical protein [Halobacterium]MDH5021789.1 hypothetical protein [Halobacterium rubrum]
MIDTMARHPDNNSSDEPTPVEAVDVDVDDTDPRSGRFSGSGTQAFPDGVIALRSRKNNNQFYISITDVVDELGYDAGEDYLHCMFEAGGDNKPPALAFEHIPNPTKPDKQNDRSRKIVDNQTSARLILPKGELGEYGVGIDLENYDNDDPYLFDPVFVESSEVFYLVPLGHVSEVFRYDERNVDLYPDSLTAGIAKEIGVDVEAVEKTLDMVSKTLSVETFTSAGIPIGDDPTVVSVAGQRLAIYDAPNQRGRSAFQDALMSIYDASPEVAEAVWSVHQEYADHLLSQLGTVDDADAERPEGDPVAASNQEAVIVPLDPPQEAAGTVDEEAETDSGAEGNPDGASTQSSLTDHGGVERSLGVPVQPSVERLASQTQGIEQDTLHDALETVAKRVTVDSLQEADVLSDREAVRIPFETDHEEPVTYSSVDVVFVEEGALPELTADLDVEEDVGEAVQQAHNKQAEELVKQRPDAPAEYRRFRQESDAVVVPVLED